MIDEKVRVDGAAARMSWRDALGRTPGAWKAAVVVGVLGWFFSLGGSTTTTINGTSNCSGTDIGPLAVAVAVAVLGVVGWRKARTGHPARRLPARLVWIGVAVLGAIVAFHVLRVVVDPAGRAC